MFAIKNQVGALYEMLLPFKKHSINLTKIESRPSKTRAWDYTFFVDMEGHLEDETVAATLKEVETNCRYLHVLGSYPRAEV
jgi:chorismate mutase/prephenate dehydratase